MYYAHLYASVCVALWWRFAIYVEPRAHPRPHAPCGRPERRCCPAPAQWNVCLLRMCSRVGVLHSAENNAPPTGLHVFSCCPFGGVLVRIMNVHATHEVAGTRVVYKFRSENVNKKNTEH